MRKPLAIVAVLAVLALVLSSGCRGPDEEPVAPQPKAPAPPPPPAVSAAHRQALIDAVAQMPAEAVVVGTIRSPRAVVDSLHAFAGPELATLSAMPFALLPAGLIDVDQPAAWSIFLGQQGPSVVFLLRLKDPKVLKGESLSDGVIRLEAAAGGRLFALQLKQWVAVAPDLEALRAFQQAPARMAVDDPMGDRIARDLAWIHLRAEPLANMVLPAIRQQKLEAQQDAPPDIQPKAVKFFEWLEDLVKQSEHIEIGMNADGERGTVRLGLTLREDASLLALARAMKPIQAYGPALPPTDRFLAASWSCVDRAEAGTHFKTFLTPAVDMGFAWLDMAMNEGDDRRRLEPLSKSLKELWAMLDEERDVLGNDAALVAEIPEPGQGVYRMTEIVTLKDGAAYHGLMKRATQAAEKVYQAALGMISEGGDAPQIDLSFDYKEGAETIEGVAVDVIRVKLDMQPPRNANMPEEARGIFEHMIDEVYGPEGLVIRVGVCGDHAIMTLGGDDLMARAIKNVRDGTADLAKHEVVRAALDRAPAGSSTVGLVSLPAYAYVVGGMYEHLFPAILSAGGGPVLESELLPATPMPDIGDLVVASVRVDDRTIQLAVDVPTSELARTIPVVRHVASRLAFYALNMVMRARGTPPDMMGVRQDDVMPPAVPPEIEMTPPAP